MVSLSSPSLTVRIAAAAIAAALLYYSSHRFRSEPQGLDTALLSAGGDDQPSADYVAGPNPLRAVGPKPDERWRVLVDAMTAEVQAADKGKVRSCHAWHGVTLAAHAVSETLTSCSD